MSGVLGPRRWVLSWSLALSCCRVGRAHCCARPPSEPDLHAFRASGSSKPQRLAGRAEVLRRCHGVLTAAASDMYETEASGLARPVALLED